MPPQSLSSQFVCHLRKLSLQGSVFSAITLVAIPLIAPLSIRANPDRICLAQLQQELSQVAQSPQLQASRVGVFVQTNEPKPKVLANLDGDRYFIPASNAKLFTTAIALKALGSDYRFATKLMSHALPNPQGTLENGLWLVGSGDPSFNSETGLKSLVTQLKNKGIKQINGGIWTRTIRWGDELVDSWEWKDLQEYYAAKVSPFTINENSLNWSIRPNAIGQPAIFEWENPALAKDWLVENKSYTASDDSMLYMMPDHALSVVRPYGQKVLIISGAISVKSEREEGSVTVPDPEANFLQLLRQELDAQGIKIQPFTTFPKKLPPSQDLAIAYSPPLSQLLTTTNKDSNNLYAELLLRAVGEKFYTKLFQKPLGDRFYDHVSLNSVNGGISSLKEYLDAIKIGSHNVLLADGSGLSRRNLTTPRAITQLLYNVADDRTFRNSLPVTKVDGTADGTLTNRWRANPLSLQAKTGTLTGVSALSGYAKPKNYPEVIFSIIINNSNLRPRELNSYVDAIVALINRLEPCL
ncbi:MAG TPA: D-alanyl-D-alanine carboxypeptidase/D-alanyl-D-alanine-endopeptidase [Pseudanabaena sp.]|nr:D-alanyl-D-alanine carboxypeptidase/D-alanyl-D-alanine-endopeptidase [Pseudanabaena sp.]